MAYVTPKTDWTATDVVQSGDLNRIEGNIAQNRADYQAADSAEASARTAAISAAISAEASARAAADSAKLFHSTLAQQTYTVKSLTLNETYTLPAGALLITGINLGSGNIPGSPALGYYEFRTDAFWVTVDSGTEGRTKGVGALVISNGNNIRVRTTNNNVFGGFINFIKIA